MNRYDSLKVSEAGLSHIETLKYKAEELARFLELFPGRVSSVALTNLQTAVMYGTRAIAENNPAE